MRCPAHDVLSLYASAIGCSLLPQVCNEWCCASAPAVTSCASHAGEIVPQSICTKYGLAVGYYSVYLLFLLRALASPIAWPMGKLLDYMLGKDDHALPRHQLQTYMTLHGETEGFAGAGQARATAAQLHQQLQMLCGAQQSAKAELRRDTTGCHNAFTASTCLLHEARRCVCRG